MKPQEPLAIQQPTRTGVQSPKALLPYTPNADVPEGNARDNRTLEERLHDAQRARTVRGLPGSDSPFVKGINFTDPMDQGAGSVMRTTQRAFGITNSHCIDADVRRHLSPDELSVRHISPNNVDKADEKYGCSKPLGISF